MRKHILICVDLNDRAAGRPGLHCGMFVWQGNTAVSCVCVAGEHCSGMGLCGRKHCSGMYLCGRKTLQWHVFVWQWNTSVACVCLFGKEALQWHVFVWQGNTAMTSFYVGGKHCNGTCLSGRETLQWQVFVWQGNTALAGVCGETVLWPVTFDMASSVSSGHVSWHVSTDMLWTLYDEGTEST